MDGLSPGHPHARAHLRPPSCRARAENRGWGPDDRVARGETSSASSALEALPDALAWEGGGTCSSRFAARPHPPRPSRTAPCRLEGRRPSHEHAGATPVDHRWGGPIHLCPLDCSSCSWDGQRRAQQEGRGGGSRTSGSCGRSSGAPTRRKRGGSCGATRRAQLVAPPPPAGPSCAGAGAGVRAVGAACVHVRARGARRRAARAPRGGQGSLTAPSFPRHCPPPPFTTPAGSMRRAGTSLPCSLAQTWASPPCWRSCW